MRYIFTFLLFLTIQAAQAQVQLIMLGARALGLGATVLLNNKAAAGDTAATPAPATPVSATASRHYVTPFTYRGEQVSRQRTTPVQLKGKGTTEILALEAALEESYVALTAADSVQSFLPAAQSGAIIAAARKAAAVRTNWDYSSYQQELAFYQREEARRQQARDKQSAPPTSN